MLVDTLGRVNVLLSRHWWNSKPRSALAVNRLDKLARFPETFRYENEHSITSNHICIRLFWAFTDNESAPAPASTGWWLSRR